MGGNSKYNRSIYLTSFFLLYLLLHLLEEVHLCSEDFSLHLIHSFTQLSSLSLLSSLKSTAHLALFPHTFLRLNWGDSHIQA